MARRALTALVAAAFVLAAGGCASLPLVGKEDTSAEARALLERAQTGMQDVESLAFTVRAVGDMDGQRLTLRLKGGAYVAGERAGDMTFALSADAPGLGMPAVSMRAVAEGGRIAVDSGDGWQVLPGETVEPEDLELLRGGFGQLDLGPYITDLAVERSTTFLGEPVTKLGATLRIRDLLDAVLDQVAGGLGSFEPAGDIDRILDGLGDVRVVLYISETTGLLKAVHESFAVEQDGHRLDLTVDIVIDGVDVPIELPKTGL